MFFVDKKMPTEIERKFLLSNDEWRKVEGVRSAPFRQGYLSLQPGRTVRVRIAGEQAYITIKGERTGLARAEFEYAIPIADANYMLDHLCEHPLIEKTRHFVPHNGRTWEIDVFSGDNAGLIIAEIEFDDPNQTITLPHWVGTEVTDDIRYYNSHLVKWPYSKWESET